MAFDSLLAPLSVNEYVRAKLHGFELRQAARRAKHERHNSKRRRFPGIGK
jgi:hypothetical protein